MSYSYRNLLPLSKTKKEVVKRLLEFFRAFVMLWIGQKAIGLIVLFSGILAR